ncbi:MFS transporter [Brevundimonas sp.]|uniref:MFS transporter n=1 Tax=Brevundimonas sp. TaxID=1871086 RepID=UPI00289F9826|nr:MFS transporter [Brevundimonas sp.]
MAFLIAVCLTVSLLEGFDLQAVSIVAPVLIAELGMAPSQTGWVFASGQVGLVVGAVIGGWIGDVYGRRGVLVAGVASFGAFCVLTVTATNFETLTLIRFATGVGIGLAMPNLVSMALDHAPERHRAKIVSIILAGLPIGGLIVALLGSAYLEAWGWKSLFYIGGLLPIAVAPFIFMLPNAKPAARPAEREDRPSWASVLFDQGRGLTTALLWSALFLNAAVLYMLVNWLPSLMVALGFDLRTSQLSSAMFSLGGCIGSFLMGFFVDRFGHQRVLPGLYVGAIAGILGIAFAGTTVVLLASAAVIGIFVVGAFYALTGVSPLYYPAAMRGLGAGASVGIGRVGSIVGPLIAGYVLQQGLGPLEPGPINIPLVAIPFAVLACLAVALVSRRPVATA